MSKLVILASCLVLLTVSTALAQSFIRSSQKSSSVVVQTDNSGGSHNSQKSSSVVVQTDNSDDENSQDSSVVVPTDNSDDENIQDSSVVVSTNTSSDMNRSTTFTSQQSSSGDSFGYQKSSLNLSAANLSKPHILSINTSGAQMTGEITVNGKVVKQISNDKNAKVDLSRYLSVGEHKVEVSARYNPPTSSVSVELSGPGTSVTQQNSGNGTLNYTMDVSVR
ncbi:MAG: hypothetical protein KME30_28570 [Iphinoe sp. HA4291-MV1]|jgi:hypothetical protein|nr:hypothetical protein [Iphinoe sp. HA4291-MV1]